MIDVNSCSNIVPDLVFAIPFKPVSSCFKRARIDGLNFLPHDIEDSKLNFCRKRDGDRYDCRWVERVGVIIVQVERRRKKHGLEFLLHNFVRAYNHFKFRDRRSGSKAVERIKP